MPLLRALSRLSTRRRHPLATAIVLLFALVATGAAYALVTSPRAASASAGGSDASAQRGYQLFLRNCSSCHGLRGEGSSDGPSLIGVGAASVDFQVGTGRMPAAQIDAQVPEKRKLFSQEEVADIAAWVATLGPGPAIPGEEQLDTSDANVAEGGEIYRTNCAMCHNFAGSGGALTQGKWAPKVRGVEPRYIYEAMLTGPQSMPVFNDETLTPEAKKNVLAFIASLEEEPSPGGLTIGEIGPVSEGAVGWVVGLGLLVGAAVWLAQKAR